MSPSPSKNSPTIMTTTNITLGYLMTHYPRLSQTFIAAEIRGLQERGYTVRTFSMNMAEPEHLLTADAQERSRQTTYLKASGVRGLIGALKTALAAHPKALAEVMALALKVSGPGLQQRARRLSHLAQAVVLWDVCAREGITQLHAHFGNAPSTIAWFATEIGRRTGSGPQTWSFTVHTLGEIMNTSDSLPTQKTASADATFACCEYTRSQVLRWTAPENWGRVQVVRCGVHIPPTLPEPHPIGSVPKVLMVGRLEQEKGQTVLVEAVEILRRRGIDVDLDLVGGGPLKDALNRQISQLGLEDRVHVLGELEPAEIPHHLQKAAVFCHPSFHEGLPVAIMEAMAQGIPVVASDVCGNPELVINAETGLLATPGDSTALADALERMLSDSDLRERCRVGAFQRVSDRHRESDCIDHLVEALHLGDTHVR